MELFTENTQSRPQDKIRISDLAQDRGSFLKILKLETAIQWETFRFENLTCLLHLSSVPLPSPSAVRPDPVHRSQL